MILQKACLFLASLICACAVASQSEKVVILYSSENCAPCVAEKKSLNELRIKFVEGSGDKNAGIQYYPTIIVLIDGVEKFRIVGQKSKEELKKLLE